MTAILTVIAAVLGAQSVLYISPYPTGQALAGAFSAYAKDSEAIYYNPAATYYGYKNDLYVTYTAWLAETSLMALSYRYKYDSRLAFGFSFTAFLSGNVSYNPFGTAQPFLYDSDGAWVLPTTSSMYSYNEFLTTFNASYLLAIDKFFIPIGANLKLGRLSFDLSADSLTQGSFFITADVGAILPVHITFGIKDEWLKRFIPERVSLTIKDLGGSFDPGGGLASAAADAAIRLGLGFNIWETKFLMLDLPSYYHTTTEIDLSTDDIFSMGINNELTINRMVSIDAMLGFKANASLVSFAGGFFTSLEFYNIVYRAGYSFALMGSLGMTHQFSFNVDFDFDIIGSIFGKDAKTVEQEKVTQTVTELKRLIQESNYKQAAFILKQLLEKYPENEKLKEIYDRLKEISPDVDLFFY